MNTRSMFASVLCLLSPRDAFRIVSTPGSLKKDVTGHTQADDDEDDYNYYKHLENGSTSNGTGSAVTWTTIGAGHCDTGYMDVPSREGVASVQVCKLECSAAAGCNFASYSATDGNKCALYTTCNPGTPPNLSTSGPGYTTYQKQANYDLEGTGIALGGSGFKWLNNAQAGKGVGVCFVAVTADPECAQDYFTYATRVDHQINKCGCRMGRKGAAMYVEPNSFFHYYKIKACVRDQQICYQSCVWLRDSWADPLHGVVAGKGCESNYQHAPVVTCGGYKTTVELCCATCAASR